MMRNHVEWRKTAVPGGVDEVNRMHYVYYAFVVSHDGVYLWHS